MSSFGFISNGTGVSGGSMGIRRRRVREGERERTGSWKEEKLIVPLEMRAGWDILKEH